MLSVSLVDSSYYVMSLTIRTMSSENNFYYLTFSLVALLFGMALGEGHDSNLMLQIFIGTVFIICLASLRFQQGWTKFLIIIAFTWLITVGLQRFFAEQVIEIIMLLLTFTFFFGTFKATAKQVLFSGHVNLNKIVGSLALFLLLGMMWSILYLLTLSLQPQAFSNIEVSSVGNNFNEMIYFSFVTLTTLGFGDISPQTPLARVLVSLEAVVGVFYMAIVVSSLVSASMSQKNL